MAFYSFMFPAVIGIGKQEVGSEAGEHHLAASDLPRLVALAFYGEIFLLSNRGYLIKGSIVASKSAFCTTPLVRQSTSPCLNSINVGADCMPY